MDLWRIPYNSELKQQANRIQTMPSRYEVAYSVTIFMVNLNPRSVRFDLGHADYIYRTVLDW